MGAGQGGAAVGVDEGQHLDLLVGQVNAQHLAGEGDGGEVVGFGVRWGYVSIVGSVGRRRSLTWVAPLGGLAAGQYPAEHGAVAVICDVVGFDFEVADGRCDGFIPGGGEPGRLTAMAIDGFA